MAIPLRSQVEEKHTWDLSKLYHSIEAWHAEYSSLESKLSQISTYSGTLRDSPTQLSSAVELYLDTMRQIEKIYTFSHLLSDQDSSNSENRGHLERVTNLYARLASLWSFLTPELLSLDESLLSSFLKSEELAPYRRMLGEILRYRPHTLSHGEEELLAMGSEGASARPDLYTRY